jgi:HSP20 family protein
MTAQSSAKDLLPRPQRSTSHGLTPLQRQMNRFFEDLGDGWDTFTDFRLTPAMDAVETEAGLELTLELPGLTREEVSITVDSDELTVTGVKRAEHEVKDRNYRVMERSYGDVRRSISLPRSVDATKVTATMSNGVLKLVAPRRAESEAKTIPIQSA